MHITKNEAVVSYGFIKGERLRSLNKSRLYATLILMQRYSHFSNLQIKLTDICIRSVQMACACQVSRAKICPPTLASYGLDICTSLSPLRSGPNAYGSNLGRAVFGAIAAGNLPNVFGACTAGRTARENASARRFART